MTSYYCDLSADFVAGRDGTDTTTEVLTGPGGFQIAIRGGGGVANEFKGGGLVAGDFLYLKGTGMVSRLVKINCNGTDVSAWEIGDTVRNNIGSGDHWTGKLVQERDNVSTGLSADDICLVQIAAGADFDDVNNNKPDGIENTTKAETSTISSVTCVGIEIDTNSGNSTNGSIHLVGCNNLFVARADQAILDGDSDATNCTKIFGQDYFSIENMTMTNASGDGMTTNGLTSAYCTFRKCIFHTNGARGFDMNSDFYGAILIQCIAYSNTDGFHNPSTNCRFIFCRTNGNSSEGFSESVAGTCFFGCLNYENGNNSDNFLITSNNCSLINCITDSATGTGSGIYINAGISGILIIGCRATNNADHGIESVSAANHSIIENWNVFYNNSNGDLQNVLSGIDSYGDGPNHIADPSDDGYVDATTDDYNIDTGKELRSVAVNLNWDT